MEIFVTVSISLLVLTIIVIYVNHTHIESRRIPLSFGVPDRETYKKYNSMRMRIRDYVNNGYREPRSENGIPLRSHKFIHNHFTLGMKKVDLKFNKKLDDYFIGSAYQGIFDIYVDGILIGDLPWICVNSDESWTNVEVILTEHQVLASLITYFAEREDKFLELSRSLTKIRGDYPL